MAQRVVCSFAQKFLNDRNGLLIPLGFGLYHAFT